MSTGDDGDPFTTSFESKKGKQPVTRSLREVLTALESGWRPHPNAAVTASMLARLAREAELAAGDVAGRSRRAQVRNSGRQLTFPVMLTASELDSVLDQAPDLDPSLEGKLTAARNTLSGADDANKERLLKEGKIDVMSLLPESGQWMSYSLLVSLARAEQDISKTFLGRIVASLITEGLVERHSDKGETFFRRAQPIQQGAASA